MLSVDLVTDDLGITITNKEKTWVDWKKTGCRQCGVTLITVTAAKQHHTFVIEARVSPGHCTTFTNVFTSSPLIFTRLGCYLLWLLWRAPISTMTTTVNPGPDISCADFKDFFCCPVIFFWPHSRCGSHMADSLRWMQMDAINGVLICTVYQVSHAQLKSMHLDAHFLCHHLQLLLPLAMTPMLHQSVGRGRGSHTQTLTALTSSAYRNFSYLCTQN